MLNAPLSSCRRFHPARVARRVGQDCRDPCCLRPAVVGSASGAPYFRGQCAFTSLRPDDSLPTLTMGLPMGFRVLVSRHPAIHATRLLTLASVGLPPTEHVSLHCCFWTHNGAHGFSRTPLSCRLHAKGYEVTLAKTPSGRQVVDLSALVRRESALDDRPPAPSLPFLCGGHRQLALENLALRHQLAVYKRTAARPKLRTMDRLFWVGLARAWTGWRQASSLDRSTRLSASMPRSPPL